VTGADGEFLDALGREDLASIFLGRADIDQLPVDTALDEVEHVAKARAQAIVAAGQFDRG
jgi:hypothetical protein